MRGTNTTSHGHINRRREEALAAIEETVAIRRELAQARPAPWTEFIKDNI